MRSRSNTVTTTGPGAGLASSLPISVSAACRRDTPMEKPVAGTGSPRKRDDEPVVAPAAADRAEAHGPAFFVLGLEQEFDLVDGAGVVFEPADDGGIDADACSSVVRGSRQTCNLLSSFDAVFADCGALATCFQKLNASVIWSRCSPDRSAATILQFDRCDVARVKLVPDDRICDLIVSPAPFGEIAALVLTACAKQLADAFRSQADPACRSRAAR